MSDCTTSPSVVSPGNGPFVVSPASSGGHRGFEVSDASLIRAGQSFEAHIANLKETVENRFQAERSSREIEKTVLTQIADIKVQNATALAELRMANATALAAMTAQVASIKDSSLNAQTVELLFRRFLPTSGVLPINP